MFSWFNNLRLSTKIGLGYAAVVFLMIMITLVNHINNEHISSLVDETKNHNEIIFQSDQTSTTYLTKESAHLQFLIGMRDESLQRYYTAEKLFNEKLAHMIAEHSDSPENQALLKDVKKLADAQIILNQASIEILKKDRDQEAALKTEQEGITKNFTAEIILLFDKLRDSHEKNLADLRVRRESAVTTTLMFNIIGPVVAVILALFLAFTTIRNVVSTVKEAVNSISTTSQEMAATIGEHERVASQQAAAVNETTSTMNELDVTFGQTAGKVGETASSANKAADIAENGAKTVKLTMETMSVLKEKVSSVADQILHLSEQTNQISSITGLVSDLANQTNLLALNAAVEAARAGEHGKGFAVVASEIRKLADQSKKSAEKINALVSDIQRATNSTVMATEEGTKNVDLSIGAARRTAEAFNELADFINTTFEVSQQTVFTVKQQVAAVKQVVEAMNAINSGVKETASGLSQTKVGVQKLNETAESLKQIV